MTAIFLSLAMLLNVQSITPSAPLNLGDRIAALRWYEQIYGRNAWSWQTLRDARRLVPQPSPSTEFPDWLDSLYVQFLNWYWWILVSVQFTGLFFVIRAWRRNRLRQAIFLTLAWCLALAGCYTLIAPSADEIAVLRNDETLLRQGNGLSYPLVTLEGVPVRLYAGVEGRIKTIRENGWMQIALSGGLLGWVPISACNLPCEEIPTHPQ